MNKIRMDKKKENKRIKSEKKEEKIFNRKINEIILIFIEASFDSS